MRFIIDLYACVGTDDDAFASKLDTVLALLRSRAAGQAQAAPHSQHAQAQQTPAHSAADAVILALPATLGARIGAVRAACAGLLAPDAVLVYSVNCSLSEPDSEPAQSWPGQAAAHVRAAFLLSLRPDLVCLLDSAGAPDSQRAALEDAGLRLHDAALPAATMPWAQWTTTAARSRSVAQPGAGARTGARPRLAYISPLPPEKSGIADYSAELLPQLARYYDIDVIVDQPVLADGWVKASLPQRSLAWFDEHARSYQRVLYHFGNSMMHKHMFALLERHPGVVVLHDFFLANVLHAMHYSAYQPAAMQRALLASHGLSALQDMQRNGESSAVWKYPCNKQVLDQAEGVIVHSDYPRQLAERWYGPGAADGWRCLPLLRGHAEPGAGATPGAVADRAQARAAARAALGLRDGQVLVCAFGLLGRTKLNHRLLEAWLATPLAGDSDCQLVFVGDAGDSDYGLDISDKVHAVKRKFRPRITGYVSPEEYQRYLAACDIAVQLRAESRGETSAAVLDCLLHGIATVANAHGSSSELPDQVLVKLDDEFSSAQLGEALLRLRADSALRASLGQAASAYIAQEHAPEHVGLQYRDAIEAFAATSPQRQYRRLIHTLAQIGMPDMRTGSDKPGDRYQDENAQASPDDLLAAATAIALNQAPSAPRQLLVDISALVQTDLKTGIQRVVRAILQELLDNPPAGYRIEPVYSTGRNAPYRYARRSMLDTIDCHLHDLEDAPAELRRGDMFLGIDLLIHMVAENRPQLEQFKQRGGQVYFVVYDLLPVLRPDVFPEGTDAYFADWLATIGAVADGLVCISRAVADELATWLAAHPPQRAAPLHLGYFHLGADIGASAPSFGMPDDAPAVLAEVRARPSLIMVGTVEPRKGQLQALDAFELLWQEGQEVNLVIVGKQGWMMDALARRLREHRELGRRLFWLPGVSDEMLLALYQASAALLAPSEGEGFGLPLIEAAQHGLPIVARDLPVFREVAGEHAFYFSGKAPADLAERVTAWLALWRAGQAPAVQGLRWLNWKESKAQLLDALIGQQWYRDIPASGAAGSPPSS